MHSLPPEFFWWCTRGGRRGGGAIRGGAIKKSSETTGVPVRLGGASEFPAVFSFDICFFIIVGGDDKLARGSVDGRALISLSVLG